MAIAGKAVNAHVGFIYLRAEYSYLVPILEAALKTSVRQTCWEKTSRAAALILTSNFVPAQVLMSVVRRQPCLNPSKENEASRDSRPPFPGIKGLFGKPTVLNNVETLANISVIFQNGWEWFRTLGTENSPGTKLFTVCGNVKRRGVFEFPMGINLKDLIYEVCGGMEEGHELLAVQTGGASGAIINASQIDMTLDIDQVSNSGRKTWMWNNPCHGRPQLYHRYRKK